MGCVNALPQLKGCSQRGETPSRSRRSSLHLAAASSAAARRERLTTGATRTRAKVKGDRMRVLLIGPPGAGKGTQADRIAAHFDLAQIATGDLLREEVAAGTQLGRTAKTYVDRGDLVPDDLVITITKARVVKANTQGGYILDGYPRTPREEATAQVQPAVPGLPTPPAVVQLGAVAPPPRSAAE